MPSSDVVALVSRPLLGLELNCKDAIYTPLLFSQGFNTSLHFY